MLDVVAGCFKLVQHKARTILDLVESAQKVLRGSAKLDDSMLEDLRVGVSALFEWELPLQVGDAQTVSSLAR